MATESDRLARDVACLNVKDMPFTLVSRIGFHCDVWRSIGRIVEADQSIPLDIDSFYPFFYLDMLTVIDEADEGLEFRIEQSIHRLEYVEWLVSETKQPDHQV